MIKRPNLSGNLTPSQRFALVAKGLLSVPKAELPTEMPKEPKPGKPKATK